MGSPWICPRSLISKIFHGFLSGWTMRMFRPNLKFVASPVPEIVIGVLGGRCKPPILGKKRRYGVGDGTI